MAPANRKKIPSRAIAQSTRAPLRTDEFNVPSAEMTIASVTQTAAPRPAKLSTTSDATCCDAATTSNGNAYEQTALKTLKRTITNATPPIKARGMVRPGSVISDPTKFRSSQPSNTHSAAASAARKPVVVVQDSEVGQVGSKFAARPCERKNPKPIIATTEVILIIVSPIWTCPPSRTPR